MAPEPQPMEVPKVSAMDAIMSQHFNAGLSSIGSLIGNTPVRSSHKEASEYESKQTSEILDPELNLGRLGYNGTDAIGWEKVKLPEKKNLYLELYSRITNYTNADCKVYIENEEFNCHLIVLQCYSELFDAYIAVKKVELPSDKCSAASFAFIYEWMITGEPSYRELNRDNVLDIFNSAKYLKIKDLVEQCWAFIDNPDVFSEDTAFLLYVDAKIKNLPEVRELMLPRVQSFFLMLVSSQDWLELELEDVKNFLKSNYISVNCEMEVFMSAVRWLKHDWVNRDKYKYEILECVRFGNIAPWQLVDIKRNPENPDFLELAKDARICKMIDDGLAFVIIKYWYGQENNDFIHWNSVLGLIEPPIRNWSGCDKTYFTYREFLIYLDQYRRSQLIEKNKPKAIMEKKHAIELIKNNPAIQQSQDKHSPRVPTMDEFLSKKKMPPFPMPNILTMPALPTRRSNLKSESSSEFSKTITSSSNGTTISGNYIKFRDKNCKSYKLPMDRLSNPPHLPTKQTEGPSLLHKNNAAVVIQRAFRIHQRNDLITYKKPGGKSNSKSNVLKMFQNSQQILKPDQKYVSITSLFHQEKESVIVFGGIDPHETYGVGRNTGKDIFKYVPHENNWEYVGDLPEPRYYHCVEFFKGRIYLVGGCDPRDDDKAKTKVVDTVWSFDPSSRQWYKEENMLIPRKHFGLVVFNKFMYAIGGQNKHKVLRSVEKYNSMQTSWEEVASLLIPRTGHCSVKYKESIWVAGGLSGLKKNTLLDLVESYNPKINQWTKITKLSSPRCFSCLHVEGDVIYCVGGAGKSLLGPKDSISMCNLEMLNLKTEKWVTLTELSIPRHGHCVAKLGTQLMVIGGVTTTYMRALSNTECFCCQRGAWVRGIACLPTALSGHAAVTLPPAMLLP
ncbi:unnamed protein product [Brassicogethes aeneus]|nr:unnamed protein product [Brassicogethes aeneus]